MIMIQNLEKLWRLTGNERSQFQDSENFHFDPVGLILFRDIENMGYWCTPENSVTFATTGGDGVHFGFITTDGQVNENSPIVMTLPCADTSNIIVGENFQEFLSLGCRNGYFELEQIEYQPQNQIPALDSHLYSSDMEQNEVELLKSIENEFNLKVWPNHAARLAELKLKYFASLQYSDEYHELTT